MKHIFRNRRAFTLVELLVVIGIIALLISMLLPSLNKAKQAAITLKCATNLRTIGQALVMYQGENRGWNPITLYDNTSWQVLTSKKLGAPYPGDRDYWSSNNNLWFRNSIYHCPSTAIDWKNSWTPSPTYMGHPIYFGGDIPKRWGWPPANSKPSTPTYWKFGYKASWLKNSAEKIIAGDGTQRVTIEPGQGFPVFIQIGATGPSNGGTFYGGSYMCEEPNYWDNPNLNIKGHPNMKQSLIENTGDNMCLRARHGGRTINLLYGDGHVGSTRISPTGETELTYYNFAVPVSHVLTQ